MTAVQVATEEAFDLAEGPFWDPVREQLLWVDIRAGAVLVGSLDPAGGIDVLRREAFGQTMGAVAVSESGEWILAGAETLLVRQSDGTVVQGPRVLPPASGRRLNDGKPDPVGRFVVGSLSLVGPSRAETLAVVQPDGATVVLDDDLTLSNGLAWSAAGDVLFSVDTLDGVVYRRDWDVATGEAGPRSVLLTMDDGSPDGMCLDEEEHLWIAVWGAGQVRRYRPDGVLDATIEVPAPHTSCVAFAGRDLDTLVITTATQDLTEAQHDEAPLSGRLFTARPGVRGLPQPLWSGATAGGAR